MSRGTLATTEIDTGEATVLVVDDESDIVDLYAHRLSEEFEVVTARGGEAALEAVDPSVDVVFLDRRMPDYRGREVLDRIRQRGLDLRVVMVTAVEPDFDIVEMPFDDYLVKPVSGEELIEATERMLIRDEYEETVQEYFALAEKRATLRAQKSEAELADSPRYQALLEELDRTRRRADQQLMALPNGGYEEAFLDV